MMNRVENIPNAWRISFRRRKSVRYFTPPDCRFSPGIKARNDSIINKLIRASSPLKRRRKEKGERRKEKGERRREKGEGRGERRQRRHPVNHGTGMGQSSPGEESR